MTMHGVFFRRSRVGEYPCRDETKIDRRLRAVLSGERLEQKNFWPAFLDASARMRALPTQQQVATQPHHRHARVGGHPVLNSSLRAIFCWIPACAGMTSALRIGGNDEPNSSNVGVAC
jgi:hypothetical protein